MNLQRSLGFIAIALTVGCAHPLVITPNMSDLSAKDFQKIDKNVGYYISKEDREKEVTTPGGGGDKVKYKPYADLEPGLQKVLSNVFSDVLTMASPNDKAFIQANKIAFIFTPTITTDSSSDSAFTWPPTKFIVDLEAKAVDANGHTIWQKKVHETGEATFSEFRSDLPLAAKRAMGKALAELQKDIGHNPAFR